MQKYLTLSKKIISAKSSVLVVQIGSEYATAKPQSVSLLSTCF